MVSDGRAGIENPALGLAEAVARLLPMRVTPKRIKLRTPWGALPRALWGDPFRLLSPEGALLRPPYPALWIANGRLSTPFTQAVKTLSSSTFTVQLQAPRAPLAHFDLVVPPSHDRLAGENVFSTIGSPNRLTATALAREAEALAPAVEALGRPRIAVLIGGANRAYSMSSARMTALARDLARLAEDGAGLMITTSRRTDPSIAQIIRREMEGRRHFFWNGGAISDLKNPYLGILGLADHIIVTGDSVNMAAEAATTGKPVYIFSLDRRPLVLSSRKFDRFHAALESCGAARRWDGKLGDWRYQPLDETSRAAEEIVRRLGQRPKSTDR